MTTDARAILDAATSEADWQQTVLHAAHTAGWRCHHQLVPYRRGKDGRVRAIVEPNTDPGVPDLLLVHPEYGVIHVELKRESGKLSRDQEEWRDALQAAGARWYMWKPSDRALVWRVLGLPEE